MSGRVVHFEVPFDDAARAQEFYRSAFGWTIMSMPEMNYTMVGTTPSNEHRFEGGAGNSSMIRATCGFPAAHISCRKTGSLAMAGDKFVDGLVPESLLLEGVFAQKLCVG